MSPKHLLISTLSLFFSTSIFASNCSESFIKEFIASKGKVQRLNCSLKLAAGDVVSDILIEGRSGSDITLDCNGAMIIKKHGSDALKISSKVINAEKLLFERAENIIIKNCHVIGGVRIMGMGQNGEAPLVKLSSRIDKNHTKRAQAAAPRHIVLERMTFQGDGRIPLYLSPGVTKVTVQDSTFSGESNGVALYLDAESAYNKILRNKFDTFRTKKREMVAIDGSAHNVIAGNLFKQSQFGVIHLYRNCGEGGTIRLQTPSHNQILGNWFPTAASKDRLIINSRSGNKKYCEDDAGFDYGSSVSNNDNGVENIIAGNLFKGKKVGVVQNENKNNHIFSNQANYQENFSRVAWCATKNKLIKHGQKFTDYETNAQSCSQVTYTCHQGDLLKKVKTCPENKIISAECRVSSNNRGCSTNVECPAGYKIFKAKAVCNLESESMAPSLIDKMPLGQIKVERASDRVNDGQCTMGDFTISRGEKLVKNYPQVMKFACREHDRNGGDCRIMGQVVCQRY